MCDTCTQEIKASERLGNVTQVKPLPTEYKALIHIALKEENNAFVDYSELDDYPKKVADLEHSRLLCGYEVWLLLQRTGFQFPVSLLGNFQPPVTLAPGDSCLPHFQLSWVPVYTGTHKHKYFV